MRKMPAFTKAPPETVERFQAATSGVSALERRTMFSYPSVFLNGNMLACVFQSRIMVRLSDADRSAFLSLPNTKLFEPSPGRAMREYVEAPPASEMGTAELRRWIERGAAYVASLPKKSKAKKATPKAVAKKSKSGTGARAVKKSPAKSRKNRR